MKKVKVTKKNAERLTNELESRLRERLAPFTYYEVSREDIGGSYIRICIFSADVTSFISSTVIDEVIEVFNQSKISRDSMFYGIESFWLRNTEREVPCIAITITIG